MNKQNQDILFRLAIAVGVYLLVIKPILQKLGVEKTPEQNEQEQQAQKAQVDPASAFSPTFYKTVKAAKLLKRIYAEQLAKILNKAVSGSFLGDDVGAIYKVFRSLQYKTQVSWLSKVYSELYNSELINDLKNGAKYAALLYNFRAGLNDNEMNVIYQIVKNLK
jgi:hypothetical protein